MLLERGHVQAAVVADGAGDVAGRHHLDAGLGQEQSGVAADVAEALHGDGRPGGGLVEDGVERQQGGLADAPAGRFEAAGQAADAGGLAGDGLGHVRLAEDDGHVGRPGAHVGRGDVVAVLQFVPEHVHIFLQEGRLLEAAQGRGVDRYAGLPAAERNAGQRRLEAHQFGQPPDLLERDMGTEADAALGRPAHGGVVDDVAVALDERAAGALEVQVEVDLLLRLAQQPSCRFRDVRELLQGLEVYHAVHRRPPRTVRVPRPPRGRGSNRRPALGVSRIAGPRPSGRFQATYTAAGSSVSTACPVTAGLGS